MLRSRATGALSAVGARTYFTAAPDPIGKPHPDIQFGHSQHGYRGRGWVGAMKQLPVESMIAFGGGSMVGTNDRQFAVQDPEDPRHPLVRAQFGELKGFDGAVHSIVHASWGEIPKSSRLLQLLYNNYLEPISMHRTLVHLMHWSKVPNNGNMIFDSTVEYVGQTACLIGNVFVGAGAVIMEGVVMRADVNQIYIYDGVQVHENVMIIADAPTTLHHYQRGEGFNPYQTLECSEGVVSVGMNTMIEPNCMIEACQIGTFNRIGHGSRIMKGVTTSLMCHILPGSVVLADTHINEGEIYGGAPARKLGKVSKFEYKKPWFASAHHRDQTAEVLQSHTAYGDQVALWQEEMDKLENLMIEFEDGLSDGVKAQIREFIEGREPYTHTIARITQGWSPANRPDDKMYDHKVPCINMNAHRNHNDDAVSEYTGTIFNWKYYLTGEKRS